MFSVLGNFRSHGDLGDVRRRVGEGHVTKESTLTPGGRGGHLPQVWVSTVKLIQKQWR